MPEPVITDHALVRYVERVHGIDMESIRQELREMIAPSLQAGASALYRDGYTYVLRGGALVTVLKGRQSFIVDANARLSHRRAYEECRS